MNNLIRNCKNKADPPGLEPRQRDSKSLVLPLHQGSKSLVSPRVTPLPQQGWTQSRLRGMEPLAGVALQLEENTYNLLYTLRNCKKKDRFILKIS
jgi:hypothetical protein